MHDGRKGSELRKQIKEAALKKMAEYYSKADPETSTFEKTHPIDQNMIAYASNSWSSIVMGDEVLDGEMTKILDSIHQLEEAAETEPEEEDSDEPTYEDKAEVIQSPQPRLVYLCVLTSTLPPDHGVARR